MDVIENVDLFRVIVGVITGIFIITYMSLNKPPGAGRWDPGDVDDVNYQRWRSTDLKRGKLNYRN